MRFVLLAVVLSGCAVDRSGLGGPGDVDMSASDLATHDAPSLDAPPGDLGPPDLGPPDLGPPDLGPPDTCVLTVYYRDADGDGHGDPASTVSGCTLLTGYVTSNDDCNDADPNVHPGALEICNGRDDNCNGMIDDGATCTGCAVASLAGHAYMFCDLGDNFSDAEAYCVGAGYHLATIEDATEDAWVAATARGIHATGWWIGYTELGGPYHWLAGSSSYTGWRPGEPSGGSEHCALIAWGGGIASSWNDGDCSYSFPFVCEVPP